MKLKDFLNEALMAKLSERYRYLRDDLSSEGYSFHHFLDNFLNDMKVPHNFDFDDYFDFQDELDSLIGVAVPTDSFAAVGSDFDDSGVDVPTVLTVPTVDSDIYDSSVELVEIQTNTSVANATTNSANTTPKTRVTHRHVASLTTKSVIPSCPIDLVIPQGYTFSASGIQRYTKKGDLELVSYSPIVITRRYIEPDTYLHKFEIAFTNHEDKWIKKIFNTDVIVSDRKILQLAEYCPSFTSSEAKHVARFLNALINHPTNKHILSTTDAYNQPGWNDDFSKFIYPTGDEKYICHRSGFDYQKLFATKGDSKKWLDMFQQVSLNGGVVARIILGAGFVAPLVRPLNLPNVQAHINGKRGIGKSPLPKFAASAFGDPRPGRLTRTFAGTMKNKLETAAAFNDLPLVLDELETIGSKSEEDKLSAMIYDFSLGVANQANKRDGTARPPVEFAGCRISTGERPLVKSTDKGGAFKRVLDIQVSQLFEDSFASELHRFSENNFGHFGKVWTEYIRTNLDFIRSDFNDILVLTQANGFYINGKFEKLDIEPTQLKAVIACAVAFKHFQLAVGFQLAPSYDDELYKDIAQIVLKLPSTNQISDSIRAKEALTSFIAGHLKSFVIETKSRDIPERTSETYEIFGKIFANDEVAILPHKLKQILEKELGFASAEKLIAEWADSELLMTQGRGNQYRVRIDGKLFWTYKFKPGVLIQKDILDSNSDTSVA